MDLNYEALCEEDKENQLEIHEAQPSKPDAIHLEIEHEEEEPIEDMRINESEAIINYDRKIVFVISCSAKKLLL